MIEKIFFYTCVIKKNIDCETESRAWGMCCYYDTGYITGLVFRRLGRRSWLHNVDLNEWESHPVYVDCSLPTFRAPLVIFNFRNTHSLWPAISHMGSHATLLSLEDGNAKFRGDKTGYYLIFIGRLESVKQWISDIWNGFESHTCFHSF